MEADEEPGPEDEDEASVLLPSTNICFFKDFILVFELLVTTRSIFFKELVALSSCPVRANSPCRRKRLELLEVTLKTEVTPA